MEWSNKSFISEQHIKWMYKIQEVFIGEKPKHETETAGYFCKAKPENCPWSSA